MAKKTLKDETQEKESIYLDAKYILEKNNRIIPISPSLDPILCGGIPEGVLALVSGPPKLGKTTLAMTAIVNGQKMGKVGVIIDVEHRSKKILKGIHDLDTSPDKLKIIASTPGNILNAEEMLTRAEKALHDYPGCIMLVDSFSMLSPKIERSEGYEDRQMAVRAALEAKFFRRVAPIISVNSNVIIGVAHMAPNIGKPGSVENIGRKAQYQLDIKISCRVPYEPKDGVKHDWFMSGKKDPVGHRLVWECETNAIGPGGKSSIGYIYYGHGIEETAEIFDIAVELGIIHKGGSWYTIDDVKFQGWEGAYLHLKNNKELVDKIYKSIKEITDNES